jgi:hypothetical protein
MMKRTVYVIFTGMTVAMSGFSITFSKRVYDENVTTQT